jgi:hypothetical protein
MIHTSFAQKNQATNRMLNGLKIVTKFSRTRPTKGRSWFLNFVGDPMILIMKMFIYCGYASLRWLNYVSCLFLSFLLIASEV